MDYLINGWYGILAPPGTPAADRAEAARRGRQGGGADPAAVEALAKQGMEPRGTQPAEWAKYMEQEKAFYTKVIKDAGIKPQ